MKLLVPLTMTPPDVARLENDCAPFSGPLPIVGLSGDLEEDCAPAVGPLHFDLPEQHVYQRYSLTPHLYTDSLPHDFTLAYGPYSPAGPVVLNLPALQRLQEFKYPQPLEQAVDYTLAACGLILPAGQKPTMQWGQPTTLTAWLHVTNACNLDCPYCYVRKSSERMSVEVGRQAVESVFRAAGRRGFKAVKLKYAGGEAALHFNLVRQLHDYARQLAVEHRLDLRAVVLSNGTVWTPAMARWLVEAGVKLMISLDAVGAAHDAQRPTRAGRGTFARIEHIVDNVLLPAGVKPDISITITARNSAAAAEAVAWAIERDLPFSLNFYRQNLQSANYEDLRLEETQIIEGLRRAYGVVEQQLPLRPFLSGLLDRVQPEAHTHTCGVGQSYLVFTHTGQVAQCQMHLDQGRPYTGADDVLELAANGSIPLVAVDEKEGCRDCLWRYRCAGGCPLETYRATGRFDVKSPHCHIYTTMFPLALRLEGLRLMKLNGVLT